MTEEYTIAGLDWSRGYDDTIIVAMAGDNIVGVARIASASFHQAILQVINFLKDYNVSEVVSDSIATGDPLNDQLRDHLCDLRMNVRIIDKKQSKDSRGQKYYLVMKAISDNLVDISDYKNELENPFYHTAFGLCLQLLEDKKSAEEKPMYTVFSAQPGAIIQ